MSDPGSTPKPRNTPLIIGLILGVFLVLFLCTGLCVCGGCFSWSSQNQPEEKAAEELESPEPAPEPAQP
jgi:hypothetical protein